MQQKVNILVISHEKQLNGASRSLIDIIKSLKDEYNIYVLSSYKKGRFIEELRRQEIMILHFPYCRWRTNLNEKSCIKKHVKKSIYIILNYINYVMSYFLAYRLKFYKFDFIYTNTSVIPLGAHLSKILKVKHVWHIREFGEEDFNFKFVFDETKCYRYMNRNTDKFIYVSDAVRNKYERWLKEDKGIRLYNFIDKNKNLVSKNYFEDQKLRLLITGMIHENKGQRVACEAVKMVLDKGYDNIELTIAGEGNDKELKKYVQESHIDKWIKFIGYQSDMDYLRRINDVELVCSRAEAFGRVTIEAMLSGNLVIGSNSGGTKELIQDGINGFLFEQGNVNELANKIIYLLNHHEEIERIGKSAFKEANSKYKKEYYMSEFMTIFEDI